MIEGAKKMQCGACGSDKVTIYKIPDGTLIAECGCGASSVIKVRPAKIDIDWGEKSEGILCVFPSNRS